MSDKHDDAIREQFRTQAATFADEGFAARGLDWIVEEIAPSSDQYVLDVTAGATQVSDPYAVVREMVRVARPLGQVATIDMTADPLSLSSLPAATR